jgi:hypothetical protein
MFHSPSRGLYPLKPYHLTPLLTAMLRPDNGAAGNNSEETVHQIISSLIQSPARDSDARSALGQ